jgi:hypothetical protein
MNVDKQKQIKQPYEKPVLRTIDLAAEEILANVCKRSPTQAAPITGKCKASSCKTQTGS